VLFVERQQQAGHLVPQRGIPRRRSGQPLLPRLGGLLQRLAALDARQARIVELRYFAGLSIEQTAESLEISPATVKRDWLSAKAWLQRELSGS
jgi:hypothetical protein